MSKPIHIMRWAPADYVNDPAVKLALAQRDFVSSTFYPLFLFHAFIQGGTLPADPVALGAILGMRPVDVRRALAYWTTEGKIQEQDGRLLHRRVIRDLERAEELRQEQERKGRLGGRPPKPAALPDENPRLQKPKASVAVAVPVAVAVARTEAGEHLASRHAPPNPLMVGKRPEYEREALRLTAEIATLTGEDGAEVFARAAHYEGALRQKVNPAAMSEDRLLNTVLDLRATLKAEQQKRGPKAVTA